MRLTQAAFGRLIGMPQQNVCRIFNNAGINTQKLVAISNALDFNFFSLYCKHNNELIHTEGDYSPASDSGDVSVIVGDAVIVERVKSLEALVAEKSERIAELKERIEELKAR